MDFNITPLQNPNIGQQTPLNWLVKYKTKLILGGSALVLVIAGLFFFLGGNGFSEGNVQVKIDGPTESAAGELIDYKVSYQNKNKVSLYNTKLIFNYPDSAVAIKDGDVINGQSSSVDLGTITPNGGGEYEFKGYLVGDKGNVKTARAVLSFSVNSISPVLEKEDQLATTITSLSVPLTLVAPPTSESGQKITYILDYRNQSAEDKEGLRIQFTYPDGFKPETYSPTPTGSNNTWDIGKLLQGSGSRVSITGTITGAERDTRVVSVILQRKISTPSGDKYIDYEKTDASTAISSPTISVNVSVNNSSNYTAHLGDRLQYTLQVKNNSTYNISSLTLTALLEGNMYNLSTVKADGFLDSRTRIVSWNSSIVPAFADFKPGQNVSIPMTVQLKSGFTSSGASGSSVRLSAHLETNDVPPELSIDKLTADDDLTTRISTSATFDQKILINDSAGAQGSFPMKVDKKTSFYVHWILTNPANAISSAKVTAVLAPGVQWESTARVNGNQPLPKYDSRTNSVTWNFVDLPAGVGTNFPIYEAVFKISLTPSANQANQSPQLLSGINFSGTDTFTKEKIVINIRDATTANVADSNESKTVQP